MRIRLEPFPVDDHARRSFATAIMTTLEEWKDPTSKPKGSSVMDRAMELDPRFGEANGFVKDREFDYIVRLADDYIDGLNHSPADELDEWFGKPAEGMRQELETWAIKTLEETE